MQDRTGCVPCASAHEERREQGADDRRGRREQKAHQPREAVIHLVIQRSKTRVHLLVHPQRCFRRRGGTSPSYNSAILATRSSYMTLVRVFDSVRPC